MKIGFITGSSNNPDKCWPPAQWIALGKQILEDRPQTEIHLYGTAADRLSTSQIAEALPAKRIQDHAGQTDLVTFARELATCAFLVGNDTGGVHLANALGTPVYVLYGPTNPLVTGPFFEAERNIIQPTDCPETGGQSIQLMEVQRVIKSFQ